MCVRGACNALAFKLELDYLSTTVCQKVHFFPSDAIKRVEMLMAELKQRKIDGERRVFQDKMEYQNLFIAQ